MEVEVKLHKYMENKQPGKPNIFQPKLADDGKMDVYIINDKQGGIFHFPLNPLDEIIVRTQKNFQTYDMYQLGEMDFHKYGEKIEEITFKVILPDDYKDGFNRVTDIKPVYEYIDELKDYVIQKEAVRLIITTMPFNNLVFIANVDTSIKAGMENCRFLSLKFRTHRYLKIKSIDTSKNKVNKGLNKTDRPNTKTEYTTHKIKKGDRLWNIAKKTLGKGSRWTEIYALNKDVIKNPHRIPIGTVIKIPKK
ncbi:LysM peptidoglycan-binding domain-containing protein [Peptostreptococcus stomatis]|uniref:LysM peptidoglycan-binding domain-containing protein n=1 Tax=Peptostreptococcus stomatis TaxID=341694 RepID=UPI0028E71440|nr:LysM peptidoglycan-binding domain-containing protein [Peptostreptococcus stomatis]